MAQFAATSSNSNNSSNNSTTAAGSTPGQMLMSSSNGTTNSGNLLRLASGAVGLGPALTSSSPRTPSASSAAPSSTCCEGGRPLVPDPLTGQPVCGCQLESAGSGSASAASMLLGLPSRLSSSAVAAAAAAAAAGMAAPPGPGASVGLGLGLGLYNPYAAQEPAFLTDQSPFYAAANAGHDLKDTLGLNGGPAPGWPYPASMYYPYDPALAAAAYPFGGYGMDLNGARRKNATRETTATLKAWLSEHKKNPYPTKGEKIMLAIITKMTLTQVSTWFANARRRLKKENKMTWEPKNRNDDDDDDDSDAMDSEEPTKDKHHSATDRHVSGDLNRPLGRADWPTGAGAALKSPCPSDEDGAHRRHDDSDNIDVESDDEELDLLSSDSCLSPGDAGRGPAASATSNPPATTAPVANKPKIWSIADMAGVNRSSASGAGGASGVSDPSHASHGSGAAFTSPFANHLTPAFTLRASPFMAGSASPGGGKMFPAIHSRLPTSAFPLDSSPYGRPPLYHPHRGYSVPNGGGMAPSLLGDPRLYNVRLPMSSSSELMAYNKLISSAVSNPSIPFPQATQRSAITSVAPSAGGSLSSSPVENLEKLAALASVSSASTMSTPPTPSTRAEMKTAAGN